MAAANDVVLFGHQCPLCDPDKVRYHLRSDAELRETLNKGRPTPSLKQLLNVAPSDRVQHFRTKLYSEHDWLAGCPLTNKLFCWPCGLFATGNGKRKARNGQSRAWSHDGVDRLGNLSTAADNHGKSTSHITASLALKEFAFHKELALNPVEPADVGPHNAMVDLNRKVMERLIDAACYLTTLNYIDHRGSSKVWCDLFFGMLQLIAKCDPLLANYLEDPDVTNRLPQTLRNLIQAISTVVMKIIRVEVKSAKFVAILFGKTSEADQNDMHFTAIRYISPRGVVVERFLNFKEVPIGEDLKVESLTAQVEDVVKSFDVADRIVAQSHNGVSGFVRVQARVRELYPSAIAADTILRPLDYVLAEFLKVSRPCWMFFANLEGVSNFFDSPGTVELLKSTAKQHVPLMTGIFGNRLIQTVRQMRLCLIDFFELGSESESTRDWDGNQLVLAMGFSAYLGEFKTVFLLNVFSDIFEEADSLFDHLRANMGSVDSCRGQVEKVISQLKGRDKFDQFYNEAVLEEPPRNDGPNIKAEIRQLYFQIVGNVVAQITALYRDIHTLQFTRLLDVASFPSLYKRFPTDALDTLVFLYGSHFDHQNLKNELAVLYSQENYREATSVEDLLKRLLKENLGEVLPQTIKLCQLVSTLPWPTLEADTAIVEKRVKSYLHKNPTGPSRLRGLTLITVERDLLAQLRSNSKRFYKLVIGEFARKDQGIDLIHK